MKRFIKMGHSPNGKNTALLILRIGLGAMMLVHGLPKMEQLMSGEPVRFVSVLGMNATFSLSLAVFAEVFCAILVMMGLGTRFAAVPLIITMLVALTAVHGNDPFAKQELALHYLLGYGVILISGAGKYSVDQLLATATASTPRRKNIQDDPTLSIYR